MLSPKSQKNFGLETISLSLPIYYCKIFERMGSFGSMTPKMNVTESKLMVRKKIWFICFGCGILVLLAACVPQGGFLVVAGSTLTPAINPSLSPSDIPTTTSSPLASSTRTATETPSPTTTDTSTVTPTASVTPSPSISLTPTSEFPDATVNVANAHCRYGPGKAYLHAADLYQGDHGLIWNRNYAGTWLWVRFDKLHYACWVAASVVEIEGDIYNLATYNPPLPKSTLYGPPKKVVAARSGDQVIVTWDEVWMTEDDDRGYLIRASVCQNGYLIDLAVHTNGTSYTFLDENDCSGDSKGQLYAVEKHGYTDSIPIPWP
jgi:hypothetical protein